MVYLIDNLKYLQHSPSGFIFFTNLKSHFISSYPFPNHWIHAFFTSNTFINNARLKLVKNQTKLSNTLRLNFCYLKIIHILHARYHPNIIWYILENKQNKKCVCFREIIRLIIMKMEMKMKKKSHRYGMNRPRSRHGHIYSKYKKCLSKMMLICIKKHLSNIWSSIYEKVKQHWDWVGKKKRCL